MFEDPVAVLLQRRGVTGVTTLALEQDGNGVFEHPIHPFP